MKKVIRTVQKAMYYLFSLLDRVGGEKRTLEIAKLSEGEKHKLFGRKILGLFCSFIALMMVGVYDVFYHSPSLPIGRKSEFIEILNLIFGIIMVRFLYQMYLLSNKDEE